MTLKIQVHFYKALTKSNKDNNSLEASPCQTYELFSLNSIIIYVFDYHALGTLAFDWKLGNEEDSSITDTEINKS